MDENKRIEKGVEEFKNAALNRLLRCCTKEQRAFFKRMYPNGPKKDQYALAICQIERTLVKNRKKGEHENTNKSD